MKLPSFLKNVLTLVSGTVVSQAVIVFSSPLLTRLFSPEEFGVLAVFSSLLAILAVVAAGRYEIAIPIADTKRDAISLYYISFSIVLISSIATVIILNLGSKSSVAWWGADIPESFFWLLPLTLLSFGLYQNQTYWAIRANSFTSLSISRIAHSISIVLFQIAGGVIGLGAPALLFGLLAGKSIGFISLVLQVKMPKLGSKEINIRSNLFRYKEYPIYTTWASLANALGTQAAPLVIAKLFTVVDVGFFALAMRVLGLPSTLIGQAVGQVFFPTIAEKENRGEPVGAIVEESAIVLLKLALPTFLIVLLVGPEIFCFIFGEQWIKAGEYAQLLVPWLILSFVSSPLSTYVLIKKKNKLALYVTVYELILRMGALGAGGLSNSIEITVMLYSVSGAIISFIYIGWVLSLAGSSLTRFIMRIWRGCRSRYLILCGRERGG